MVGSRSIGDHSPAGRLTSPAPLGAVLEDPVRKCGFKTNIAAGFLRLNPLVAEDFLAFSLEFPIERRMFKQVASHDVVLVGSHNQNFQKRSIPVI